MFSKIVKGSLEIELQEIAAAHGFAPKILTIDGDYVEMESVQGQTLRDKYTDEAARIPDAVWLQVESILLRLYELEGIEYVDITSYNFMEDEEGKVWIIDFGDAYYTPSAKGEEPANWFLRSLLKGDSGKAWNTDFA
jgi:predicted Ser/Thr protein kinase